MALPIKLRLKRNETDRGVLMIYSPRLINKHYEKLIWQSLPPMKRTRKEAEALAQFFFGKSPEFQKAHGSNSRLPQGPYVVVFNIS